MDDSTRATLQEIAVSRETLGELRSEIRWLREHLNNEVDALRLSRQDDSRMLRELLELLHGKDLEDGGGLLGEVRAQRVASRHIRAMCAAILIALVIGIVKDLLQL